MMVWKTPRLGVLRSVSAVAGQKGGLWAGSSPSECRVVRNIQPEPPIDNGSQDHFPLKAAACSFKPAEGSAGSLGSEERFNVRAPPAGRTFVPPPPPLLRALSLRNC